MKTRNKNWIVGRHAISILTHPVRPEVVGAPRASFALARRTQSAKTTGRMLRVGPVTLLVFSGR